MISQKNFDYGSSLIVHRSALLAKQRRLLRLVETVDQTIKQIKGEITMTKKEMFKGFDPLKQAEYEKYLVNRYGLKVESAIQESKNSMNNWAAEDYRRTYREWEAMIQELGICYGKGASADCEDVQAIIARHYALIKLTWTPDRNSYIGLGQSYTDFAWADAFKSADDEHPKLASFLAAAMKVYAEKNLK